MKVYMHDTERCLTDYEFNQIKKLDFSKWNNLSELRRKSCALKIISRRIPCFKCQNEVIREVARNNNSDIILFMYREIQEEYEYIDSSHKTFNKVFTFLITLIAVCVAIDKLVDENNITSFLIVITSIIMAICFVFFYILNSDSENTKKLIHLRSFLIKVKDFQNKDK